MGPVTDIRPTPETMFRCEAPKLSRGWQVLLVIVIGVILGVVGWFKVDGMVGWGHIGGWVMANVAGAVAVWMLVSRNPLLAVGVGPAGLSVYRQNGRRTFAWGEIEAARFQDYPIVNTN